MSLYQPEPTELGASAVSPAGRYELRHRPCRKHSRRTRRTLLAAASAASMAAAALVLPFAAGSRAMAATVGPAAAAPASDTDAGTDSDAGTDAAAMLEQAWSRSRSGTYHGVQLVMVDNLTHYVGVSHVPGHTYLYPVNAGVPSQVYDSADDDAASDQLSKDPLALLKAHYRLSLVGTDEVLGRAARVIEASTADGRVAARFWVDAASCLLVRRDTYDAHQNAYTHVQYTELDTSGPDPALLTVRATAASSAGAGSAAAGGAQDAQRLKRLTAAGWWARPTLPGELTLYDVREIPGSAGTVLHLSYSDGISTVSVFEQRGRLAGGTLPAGWSSTVLLGGRRVVRADGVPLRVAWQAHQLVVAVIADVPPASLPSIVAALPYGAAPAGHGMVVGRLSRGLHRIGSMLDPLR